MPSERSFRDHLDVLSQHLRSQHGLTLHETDSVLANERIQLHFFPGWPKDPYVEVHVSFPGSDALSPETYFELRRYVDYVDGWDYFPIRYPHRKSTQLTDCDREYLFPGSPHLIQEYVAFLSAHGEPLFAATQTHLDEFMAWKRKQDKEYNDAFLARYLTSPAAKSPIKADNHR